MRQSPGRKAMMQSLAAEPAIFMCLNSCGDWEGVSSTKEGAIDRTIVSRPQ
jgi:hypothetical protein